LKGIVHFKKLNIIGLRFDIYNAPYHRLFDNHEKCSTYFCKDKNNTSTELNVNKKCISSISREIDIIISRLSKNADSLILDVDNNICEQLNSIINKFLGGERINFSQKSSYITRINAAVISFNSKEYLRAIKKHVTNTSLGNF